MSDGGIDCHTGARPRPCAEFVTRPFGAYPVNFVFHKAPLTEHEVSVPIRLALAGRGSLPIQPRRVAPPAPGPSVLGRGFVHARFLASAFRRRYSPVMPRRLLGAVLLAGACSASPSASKPACPGAADVDAECPAPAATPTPLGAPYQRAGDPRRQDDALTFWGWSRDGRYFAYETFDRGPGAATCEGAVRLFVVDADADVLVPGGYVERRPDHPDQEPCTPPDLRAAIAPQRAALLQEHGIEVGHVLAPAEPAAVPAPAPGLKAYAVPLPSGRTATATIQVIGGDRERAFEAQGSAFRLDLAVGGQPALTLSPGLRRRPYIWDYDLDRGLVFTSPDGSHMAILTATTEISFEGDRTSWTHSAFRIPAGW